MTAPGAVAIVALATPPHATIGRRERAIALCADTRPGLATKRCPLVPARTKLQAVARDYKAGNRRLAHTAGRQIMARHGLLVMTYDEVSQRSCAFDAGATRVQLICGTVQHEHPDSLREMPAATEPAPAVVDFLKPRERLPIDGDWVWVGHGRGVEVCASALGEIIDRGSASEDDVNHDVGVAADSRPSEHSDPGRETPLSVNLT